MDKLIKSSFASQQSYSVMRDFYFYYPYDQAHYSLITINETRIYGLDKISRFKNATASSRNEEHPTIRSINCTLKVPPIFVNGSVTFWFQNEVRVRNPIRWQIIASSDDDSLLNLNLLVNSIVNRLLIKNETYTKGPQFVYNLNYTPGMNAVGEFILAKFKAICDLDLANAIKTLIMNKLLNVNLN